MQYLNDTFLGKEVQIYPGDTYAKYGIVKDICEQGVTFEITNYTDTQADWKAGQLIFVAFGKLTFALKQ
jgi:hypothetical protein